MLSPLLMFSSGREFACWDWPVAYPQTRMSVLLLHSATQWRSNLDATWATLRLQPPHHFLNLSLRWITSFLVLVA